MLSILEPVNAERVCEKENRRGMRFWQMLLKQTVEDQLAADGADEVDLGMAEAGVVDLHLPPRKVVRAMHVPNVAELEIHQGPMILRMQLLWSVLRINSWVCIKIMFIILGHR